MINGRKKMINGRKKMMINEQKIMINGRKKGKKYYYLLRSASFCLWTGNVQKECNSLQERSNASRRSSQSLPTSIFIRATLSLTGPPSSGFDSTNILQPFTTPQSASLGKLEKKSFSNVPKYSV